MAISFGNVISLHSLMNNFLVRCVMVQKRKRIQVAESKALMMLTIRATCVASLVNCENRLAVSIKNGAPGGWPISSL